MSKTIGFCTREEAAGSARIVKHYPTNAAKLREA